MKFILSIILSLAATLSYSCTCTFAGIQNSYKSSSLIFYGKHIGTDTLMGFRDLYGKPFIVENFEIYQVYRGIDSATFKQIKSIHKSYLISILSNCGGACEICFENDKKYLVYAYRDFQSGHLTTDGCTRTREIKNENFIVKRDNDPDFGKDETAILLELNRNDLSQNNLSQYNSLQNFKIKTLEEKLEAHSKEISHKTLYLYLVSFISLSIIALLIFQLRRQKNKQSQRS